MPSCSAAEMNKGNMDRRNDNRSGGANRQADMQRASRTNAAPRRKSETGRFERELLARKAKRDAERRRRGMRNRVIITAVLAAVIMALMAALFLVDFLSTPDSEYSGKVTIKIGDESERVSADIAYTEGSLAVSFNRVAEYLGMDVIGGADSMKFVISDSNTSDSSGSGDEQYVVFRSNDAVAEVNGVSVRMSASAKLVGSEMWIPVDFIESYLSGITVTASEKSVTVVRNKISAESGSAEAAKYEKCSFLLSLQQPLDRVEENEIAVIPEITFSSDLSEYEQYMNPEDRDAYLLLVNKTTLLSSDYIPPKLTDIINTRADGRATQQMQECAARALEALFIEMYAAGYTDVSVMSGYRSYDYQEYLYNYYISLEMQANASLTREEAEAIVSGYSAKAGTSEHQSGLCIDMHNLPSASTAFAYTEAYAWLSENAWKFGFILRFPEGSYDITGYTFEPWHYRFVGRYHAYLIHEAGITLEEYLEGYATEK